MVVNLECEPSLHMPGREDSQDCRGDQVVLARVDTLRVDAVIPHRHRPVIARRDVHVDIKTESQSCAIERATQVRGRGGDRGERAGEEDERDARRGEDVDEVFEEGHRPSSVVNFEFRISNFE